MTRLILRLFDGMHRRPLWCLLLFLVVTAALCLAASRLSYKEDISDFLPLDKSRQEALRVYQDAAGANNFIVIVGLKDTAQTDPDRLVEAVDAFVEAVQQGDAAVSQLPIVYRIDMEQAAATAEFVYQNIPYFLQTADYRRMDSLLAQPDFIASRLERDKQMLMFPGLGMQSDNIGRDPLGLFTPVMERLRTGQSLASYEPYNGYLLSPDRRKAVIVVRSPYGSSETEHNRQLLETLERNAAEAQKTVGGTSIRLTGGPAIAVGNASQIKTDSVISVSVAVVLILLLLLLAFRSAKNILLIAIAIAWGWVFALGGLALMSARVSVIVLGISSVILGIAVNYPLHLIAHLYHTDSVRGALKEIAAPLVVGNITTVGAFLCLVPLNADALRDLGWFSSFLLVGTILFVLLFLPHVVRPHRAVRMPLIDRLSSVSLENKPAVVAVVLLLTVALGVFSLNVKFDTDMSRLNYMTAAQQADMTALRQMMPQQTDEQTLYMVSADSTIDGALDKSLRLNSQLEALQRDGRIIRSTGCTGFLASADEQQLRLRRWREFTDKHGRQLLQALRRSAETAGFAPSAFSEFAHIMQADYAPQPFAHFRPLSETVFRACVTADSAARRFSVIDMIAASPEQSGALMQLLDDERNDCRCFDIQSLNSTIANNLSDNFNYIGWACAVIVFFFLWFSLGSIELALLSFLPMAVSWLWILGLMALGDIRFNIVNIILATFIFGQGDDYTIFMTEGASYEYAYRRRMLPAYKRSIMLSALIMFIGIGSLIIARHPALRSLAQVTIVGMFSVVLMAYLLSPWCFNLLVKRRGEYRLRPLSLAALWRTGVAMLRGGRHLVAADLARRRLLGHDNTAGEPCRAFRETVQRHAAALLRHLPGVSFAAELPDGEDLSRPALLVMQRPSAGALLVATALCSKAVAVTDVPPTRLRMLNRLTESLSAPAGLPAERWRAAVDGGLSPVAFIDNMAADEVEALLSRARADRLDVIHITLHGLDHVLPDGLLTLYPGSITAAVGARETAETTAANLCRESRERYDRLAARLETPDYFRPFVLDRYRYKGAEVFGSVRRRLKQTADYRRWEEQTARAGGATVEDGGFGEYALLYALTHRDSSVEVVLDDTDRVALAEYSARGVANNVKFKTK